MRSYGQAVDDASITAAVKSKLVWSKHTDGQTAEVETNAGTVTLTGTAESAKAKLAAERLALNTTGVVAVSNQLVVSTAAPSLTDKAKSSTAQAGREITDSWITTKVKSTLLYSSNVKGSDVEVSTKAGVVTLGGKLGSGAERALAVELADNVRGVKAVNAKGLTF